LQAAYDEALSIFGWENNVADVLVSGNTIINTGTEIALGLFGWNLQIGGVNQSGTLNDVNITGNLITGKSNILTGATRALMANNVITGPQTSGGNAGIYVTTNGISGAAQPVEITIEGNVINAAYAYGVYSTAADILIARNRVVNAGTTGIATQGGYVEGNTVIVPANKSGIQASNGTIAVTRNVVNGGTYSSTYSTGIFFGGVLRDCLIADNLISGCGYGITLYAESGLQSYDIRVLRNEIRAVTNQLWVGILVEVNGGTFIDCVLEGNHVFTVGPSMQDYFITYGGENVNGWRKIGNFTGQANTPIPALTGASTARPDATGNLLLGTSDAGLIYTDTNDGHVALWTGSAWKQLV
jgi:hypothetical protein